MKKFKNYTDLYYIVALVVITAGLFFVPNGFDQPRSEFIKELKAEVIAVDNREVRQIGAVTTGTQVVRVRVLRGEYSDATLNARNNMMGKKELDTIFEPGDTVYATLRVVDGKIKDAVVHDHYRINVELLLFGLFFLFIILVGGLTGARAVLTFAFTAMFLWRVLFPAFLRGWNPIWVAIGAIAILTFVIIFGIGGFTKKGLVAFLGSIAGTVVTCLLSLGFGALFKIHGAVRPFSETLLYTGFPDMNISDLFLAGIFIASAGALMDVGMDIAASMNEMVEKKVEMSILERFKSGMAVGKAVIGTMTTTLLLAYTGGYTAMFMVFITNNNSLTKIFNLQYVSAEVLHTLVGSFGLVTVAPLTALFGAFLFHPKPTKSNQDT